jgi:hypothetical protein
MEHDSLRTLIRAKLRSGRLPYNRIPRLWGGPGAGETCDACGAIIPGEQMVIEGIALSGGRQPLQLHVPCFGIWDAERREEV